MDDCGAMESRAITKSKGTMKLTFCLLALCAPLVVFSKGDAYCSACPEHESALSALVS